MSTINWRLASVASCWPRSIYKAANPCSSKKPAAPRPGSKRSRCPRSPSAGCPDAASALACNTTWTALGTVGHWGHVHTRKNLYQAMLTVEPVDGAWKITALELLEEKRLDPTSQSAASKTNKRPTAGSNQKR